MSQAGSDLSSDAVPDAASRRSWWLTLPGLLTGLAGLISAITGLVVAVQQLRPSHAAAPPTQAAAAATLPAAKTSPAAAAAAATTVDFPAGRHAQIGDLRYDVLGATGSAGNPGELALALRIRLTNGSGYGANFWSRTFRLRSGSDTSAPTNFLDDVVAGGTTETAEVDFTLPSSARQATLLIGDDAAHAVALPIALKGAHT